MSKFVLTDKQVKKLSENKWIKKVSNKAITYTDEFKYKLVNETRDFKKIPRDIFIECKISPEWIGMKRIESCAKRWRKKIKTTGSLEDTRKGNSGRKLNRTLSDAEKLERAEARIKFLEAENELLKKNEMIEMGLLTDIKSISNLK